MNESRADRTAGLLLALVVAVATLWVLTIFYGLGWEGFCGPGRGPCEMGGCRPCHPAWPGSLAGVAAWAGGVVALLGGLWSAWRVGSGRWGLRRKPLSTGRV